MLRRGVAPPWQALHLPSMYAARDRPAKHHRCAITGWRDEERDRIIYCIEHIGAKVGLFMPLIYKSITIKMQRNYFITPRTSRLSCKIAALLFHILLPLVEKRNTWRIYFW